MRKSSLVLLGTSAVCAVALSVKPIRGLFKDLVKEHTGESDRDYERRFKDLCEQLSGLSLEYSLLEGSLEKVNSEDELDEAYRGSIEDQMEEIASEYENLRPDFIRMCNFKRDGSLRPFNELPAWVHSLSLTPSLRDKSKCCCSSSKD